MKVLAPLVFCLLVAAIGHSAEPDATLPGVVLPDGQKTQAASFATDATENVAPERLSLGQRLTAPFMKALDADRKRLAEKVQIDRRTLHLRAGHFSFS